MLHFKQRDIKDVLKVVKYLLFRAEFILILIKDFNQFCPDHCKPLLQF